MYCTWGRCYSLRFLRSFVLLPIFLCRHPRSHFRETTTVSRGMLAARHCVTRSLALRRAWSGSCCHLTGCRFTRFQHGTRDSAGRFESARNGTSGRQGRPFPTHAARHTLRFPKSVSGMQHCFFASCYPSLYEHGTASFYLRSGRTTGRSHLKCQPTARTAPLGGGLAGGLGNLGGAPAAWTPAGWLHARPELHPTDTVWAVGGDVQPCDGQKPSAGR